MVVVGDLHRYVHGHVENLGVWSSCLMQILGVGLLCGMNGRRGG